MTSQRYELERTAPTSLQLIWRKLYWPSRRMISGVSSAIRNSRNVRRVNAGTTTIKLELASSRREGRADWMFSDWGGGGDFNFDLTKPFPLRDETVSAIYMSHALEHFSYPSPMLKLLSECKRLLQKGGTLRISVPNARLFVNAYLNPSNFPKEKFCGWEVGLRFDAPIDYLNFVAYLGNEHKHLFDEEGLAAILRECGFSNVRIDEFDSDVDLASRDHESLYAVATK